jgi:hypothetical protein
MGTSGLDGQTRFVFSGQRTFQIESSLNQVQRWAFLVVLISFIPSS